MQIGANTVQIGDRNYLVTNNDYAFRMLRNFTFGDVSVCYRRHNQSFGINYNYNESSYDCTDEETRKQCVRLYDDLRIHFCI